MSSRHKTAHCDLSQFSHDEASVGKILMSSFTVFVYKTGVQPFKLTANLCIGLAIQL